MNPINKQTRILPLTPPKRRSKEPGLHRATRNRAARRGEYSAAMESA
ncbi:MAG TPA: hypothetical protein VMV88_08015 [Gallionella sp.]|nr:hypothetical protein [Gallionella sp.]